MLLNTFPSILSLSFSFTLSLSFSFTLSLFFSFTLSLFFLFTVSLSTSLSIYLTILPPTLTSFSSLSFLLHFYQLCEPSNKELAAVGVELRKRLVNTRANVMKVTRSEDFSNGFQLLKVLYVHLYGVKSPVSPIVISPLGISLKGTPVD